MLNEYWNDFDYENKVKEKIKKFKFLSLDDPFSAAFEQENNHIDTLMKNFDPNNPPILSNYEILKDKYRIPSKRLLTLEKENYQNYIKKLRKVTKTLVKRTEYQCKQKAREFIIQKFDNFRTVIRGETNMWFVEFIKLLDELKLKDKYIKD